MIKRKYFVRISILLLVRRHSSCNPWTWIRFIGTKWLPFLVQTILIFQMVLHVTQNHVSRRDVHVYSHWFLTPTIFRCWYVWWWGSICESMFCFKPFGKGGQTKEEEKNEKNKYEHHVYILTVLAIFDGGFIYICIPENRIMIHFWYPFGNESRNKRGKK